MADSGEIVAIYIAPVDGGREQVERVRAHAGEGLEGDRYREQPQRFRKGDTPGRDLTLIESEAFEGLKDDTGIALEYPQAGRNVVTRGIRLNDLLGRRFRVGEVECMGMRLCDPCRHLESVTQPGVLRGLVNRGGLRADVLSDGWIGVGDEVRAVDASASAA